MSTYPRSKTDHDQERKYFDSGDFALSAAGKASSTGPIQTGKEHPLLKGISHLSSPVPKGSNVNSNADIPLLRRKSTNEAIHISGLTHHKSASEEEADKSQQVVASEEKDTEDTQPMSANAEGATVKKDGNGAKD